MSKNPLNSLAIFLSGLGFVLKELRGFMRVRKEFRPAPVSLVLPVSGVLIILVNCPVAVFIHTLF